MGSEMCIRDRSKDLDANAAAQALTQGAQVKMEATVLKAQSQVQHGLQY